MPEPHPLRLLARRAHRAAEAVAALLLAVIFVAFIIQIVFRYAFNLPVGWTAELSRGRPGCGWCCGARPSC